jgi:photosystem II stability/assembly factor-like uncharacterized protein
MRVSFAVFLVAAGAAACSSSRANGGSITFDGGPHDTIPDAAVVDAPADTVGVAPDAALNWRAVGLDGNNFHALAVDPKAPATVYAGTTANGIYRSRDAGATWVPIDTGLPNATLPVRSIAIDPVTTSTLYIGVGANGLFKSVDGGDTWTTTGIAVSTPNSIIVDPATPSTLWTVGSTEGVFKSVNGGGIWTKTANTNLPLGSSALTILGFDPKTKTLFCGVDSLVLMKSVDGGDTWTSAAAGLTLDAGTLGGVLAIAAQPSGVLFAQTAGAGLYTSTNTGGSWAHVDTMKKTQFAALAVDILNPATIYVSADEQGILRSTDDGGTWQIGGPPTTFNAMALAADGTIYLGARAGTGIWTLTTPLTWP